MKPIDGDELLQRIQEAMQATHPDHFKSYWRKDMAQQRYNALRIAEYEVRRSRALKPEILKELAGC